jgi:hypothetical protein
MAKRRGKAGRLGRVLEVLADLALILIVVAFGLSIVRRYQGGHASAAAERTPPRATPVAAPAAPVTRDRPTVDIRNGCGKVGLAEVMMRRLRHAGFDVVEFKNADRSDYESTLVKDRSGHERAAEVAAFLRKDLGVGRMVEDRVATPSADVLLILGRDLADTLEKRERRNPGR